MPDSSTTRASLLSRVRDGSNDRAWREFSDRYGDLIVRYGRQRGLQQTDAEDVRQLVLMGLSRSLRSGGFRYSPDKGRFRDYLGATVRHAIQRFSSRHAPGSGGLSLEGIAEAAGDAGSDPDALWEREWTDHHFRLAMAQIRATFEPRSVAVFERVMAGTGMEVIAEECGISVDAVRHVKHRVLVRLKELVAEQVRAEDEPDG